MVGVDIEIDIVVVVVVVVDDDIAMNRSRGVEMHLAHGLDGTCQRRSIDQPFRGSYIGG